MKVTLLVSEWCNVCPSAERVWRQVNGEKDFELEVLDVAQPEGRKVVAERLIKTVPATLVDGELRKVGVPGAEEARELVRCAPPRAGGSVEQAAATMTMQRGPRHLVRSSVVYLALAGLTLVRWGDLLGGGIGLLHLFTYGFIAFMIFGVAEHMLPRFTGHPVRTGWLQAAQILLLHGGLWVFAAGRWFGVMEVGGAGALLMWLGVLAATARLMPLVWRPSTAEMAARAQGAPGAA